MYHTMPDRIRHLMADRGLSAADLAQRAEVPLRVVDRIMSGAIAKPPPYVVSALAYALGVETIYLAKGVDPSLDQTFLADPDAADFRSADELRAFLRDHHVHWKDTRTLWSFAMRADGDMTYEGWTDAYRQCFGRSAEPRPQPLIPLSHDHTHSRQAWSCPTCGCQRPSQPAKCPDCGRCCPD
jgi:transcriptional regulator with XRE-family HTH domain